MCYETSLTKKLQAIEDYSNAQIVYPEVYQPYYHNASYTYPNLYCIPIDDPTEIQPMEWGLVPNYIEDIEKFRKGKYKTWNAKEEKLFSSGFWKGSIKSKRCLILADGFFEPHYEKGVKGAIPKYCYLENYKLFTFAGIYTELDSDYRTVSLITKEANDFFAEVHNKKKRMPLVLDRDFEGEWLNPNLKDNDIKELLKHGFTKEEFHAHTVRRDFYKTDDDLNNPRTLEEDNTGTQTLF